MYKFSDKGKPPIISDRLTIKNKFEHLFIKNTNNSVVYVLDNCSDETIGYFTKETFICTQLGNSECNNFIYKYVVDNYSDDDIVYICEDDYLYDTKNGSYDLTKVIYEGLERSDYVSLMDHPDKYLDGWGNPYVQNGGENTKVILTKSVHWKFTNSTTMTFACKVKTLKEDFQILNDYNDSKVPRDFEMFLKLYSKGRKLITPIPGLANHCGYFPATPFFSFI